MSQRRGIGYFLLLIGVVLAPTVVSLSWYQITKDPNLRPLAVTKQALTAYGIAGDGLEIVAVIQGAAATTSGASRQRLSRAITESFAAKGLEVRITFRPDGGEGRVTYRVGSTFLGPYPTVRAAEGIAAAVEAYRMH